MGSGARTRAFASWLWIAAFEVLRAHACAQDPASALTIEGPASCPDGDALRSELASLVGRPIEEITLPDGLDPHVVVTAEGARFVLEVHEAQGARTLRDRSCSALVRAAALIVALRIDADAATLAAATAAEPPPPPAPPPDVVPPPPPRRTPRRRVGGGRHYDAFEWSRRLAQPSVPPTLSTVSIGAGMMVEGGVVPSATASIAGDVVIRVDRFEARVRGSYVLEQGGQNNYGVAASAVLGSVLGCGRPFEVSFAIAFCGGIEAGPLLTHAYGVMTPVATTTWTVAGVVGVWLPLFPWHGIDVSLGVEVWGRFYRPQFIVLGLGHVWDSDPFGGRFALLVHFGV